MKRYVPFAVILVAWGCNRHGGPESKLIDAPPTLPAGWAVARSLDGKISIGVAPGWRAGVDRLTEGSLSGQGLPPELRTMAAAVDKESKEQEAKQLADMRKKGIEINVIDSSKPTIGEARTRYRVVVGHADWNINLTEAYEVEKKIYFENVKPTPVKLPIGDAYESHETRNLRDGGVLTNISYLVVNGKDMISLRFTTEGDASTITTLAPQVAQTLRVKP